MPRGGKSFDGEGFPCPVCHAQVPAGAVSCKSCGADEQTGWAVDDPETAVQDLDLERSLDDERYAEFLDEDEAFGGRTIDHQPSVSRWGLFLVILGVLAVASLLALLTSSGHKS